MSEEEKKAIELLSKKNTEYYYRYVDVREAVSIVLNLIKKQDKIIKEMAYRLASVDDRLCEYIDITMKNNNCRAEEDCQECVKKYFERKIENE